MVKSPSPTAQPPAKAAIPGPNYVYRGYGNLYVNLTSRCSANCGFCIRNFTWEVFGYDLNLSTEQEPDADQVIKALEANLAETTPHEVVFTGLGEPTIKLGVLLEVVRWLKSAGLPSRLDTNGHGELINPGHDVVAELKEAGLGAVSVSLNAADASSYDSLCSPERPGAFDAVTSFIKRCVEAGIETKASVVEVAQVDPAAAAQLAGELGVPLGVRHLITPGRIDSTGAE